MKTKKIGLALLAAASLLAFNGTARADDTNAPAPKSAAPADKPPGGPGGQRGQRMTPEARLAQLSEQLGLSDDQKTKVKTVLEDQGKVFATLRDATPEERQSKMKAAREEMNAKMKEILTADQYAKFEKMRPGRGPGGGRPPGGPGGEGKPPGDNAAGAPPADAPKN